MQEILSQAKGASTATSASDAFSNEAELLAYIEKHDSLTLDRYRNSTGRNVVNFACSLDSVPAIQALHAKGVSFNQRDQDYYSCLDTCAADGSKEALTYILDNGIAPNMINAPAPINGFVPVIHAKMRGNTDCLELLKDYGANLKAKNAFGVSVQ